MPLFIVFLIKLTHCLYQSGYLVASIRSKLWLTEQKGDVVKTREVAYGIHNLKVTIAKKPTCAIKLVP